VRRFLLTQVLIFLCGLQLTSSDTQQIAKSIEATVLSRLAELDAEDGAAARPYTELLFPVLFADAEWLAWKTAKNSADFTFPPMEPQRVEVAAAPKRSRSRASAAAAASSEEPAAKKKTVVKMGNTALTKLWNHDWAALDDPRRAYRPSLTAFLTPLAAQLEPQSGVEAEYLLSNDDVFVWRANRLLLCENIHAFNRPNVALSDTTQDLFPDLKAKIDAHREQHQHNDSDPDEDDDFLAYTRARNAAATSDPAFAASLENAAPLAATTTHALPPTDATASASLADDLPVSAPVPVVELADDALPDA
jgi:hypothetical protein